MGAFFNSFQRLGGCLLVAFRADALERFESDGFLFLPQLITPPI